MPSNTAIAVVDGKPVTLEVLLDRAKGEIAKALPFQMPIDRLYRTAITTVRKNPGLQNCNALSIVACVIQGAQLGLEMDGVLGNAYMVPYGTEANFQVGYKGLIALSYRSDRISRIDAKWACEGDQFYYEYGTNSHITHIPKNESDERTHYYCIVYLSDGTFVFQVMTKKQVDSHRDRYSPSVKKGKHSPWDTSYDAMALKTVIRQTLKTTPISTEIQTAISLDEQAEAGIPQQLAKDLSAEITGGRESAADYADEEAAGDILDNHNRDEYPSRGKHSESAVGPKADPKTYRNIPQGYLDWGIATLKPCEMKDRIIAEIAARNQDKQPKQETTDAEFEDNATPSPASTPSEISELAELLKCPALTGEITDSIKREAESSPHDLAWYRGQIKFVQGLIADAEKEKEATDA